MSSATEPHLAQDLAPLVPASSRGRVIGLAIIAVVVLVAAWLSPLLLRPTLDGGSSSAGSSKAYPGQVLVISETTVHAWPNAALESIDDVPGARVAAAWLLDAEPELMILESDAHDPAAMLRASYPHADITEDGNLPAEFRTGDSVRVAVLWDIDDCYALDENAEAFATLRTAIGTTARTPLPWTARPDYLVDAEFDNDDEYSALACTPSTP